MDAVLQRHRGRDLERQLVRVHRVERAVIERCPEVGQRIAGENALGRRFPDALLDAGKEPLRHRPADHALGELDAAIGVRLELEPDIAEHPVAAGLLLVPAVHLGLAADRLLIWHARRVGRDRGSELSLQALDDHRGVRLAHRPQDLLAGRAALEPDRRLLLEHAGEGRTHLVEVALRLGLDRDHQRRLAGTRAWARPSGRSFVVSVSPVSVTASLAIAPISPASSWPIGSCSLPCNRSS